MPRVYIRKTDRVMRPYKRHAVLPVKLDKATAALAARYAETLDSSRVVGLSSEEAFVILRTLRRSPLNLRDPRAYI